MSESTPKQESAGRLLLKDSDFVTVYGPDGATKKVPKHWRELPWGFSKTKPKDD